MQTEIEIQKDLQRIFENEISVCNSLQAFEEKLAALINRMIEDNFEKLISILYRVDVSEQKLKHELQQHTETTAGQTIAKLLIERQIQKVNALKQNSSLHKSFETDEEKW